jgi:hypothetical protein
MSRLEELARDIEALIEDYYDHDRDVIAGMGFKASVSQLLYEKYGISL